MAYDQTAYNRQYYAANKRREKFRALVDYWINKPDRRAANKRWCAAHKEERRRASIAAYRDRRRLIDALKDVPCVDCKNKYKPWVMQFDHRNPQEKLFTVGMKITLSWRTIVAEVAKCDIVCANCHAERTHKRQVENGRA